MGFCVIKSGVRLLRSDFCKFLWMNPAGVFVWMYRQKNCTEHKSHLRACNCFMDIFFFFFNLWVTIVLDLLYSVFYFKLSESMSNSKELAVKLFALGS